MARGHAAAGPRSSSRRPTCTASTSRARGSRSSASALVAEEHAQKVFETNIALIRRALDLMGDRPTPELLADELALHESLKRMTEGLTQLQGIFTMDAAAR
jgi:hypothetical protein